MSIPTPDPAKKPFQIQVAERVTRLPPYLFGRINALLYNKRRAGDDVIDLGMGNPSRPARGFRHREAGRGRPRPAQPRLLASRTASPTSAAKWPAKYFKRVRRAARPGRGSDRLPRLEGRLQPHVPGDDGPGRHGDRAGAVFSDPRLRDRAGLGNVIALEVARPATSSSRTSPTPASTSTRGRSC